MRIYIDVEVPHNFDEMNSVFRDRTSLEHIATMAVKDYINDVVTRHRIHTTKEY